MESQKLSRAEKIATTVQKTGKVAGGVSLAKTVFMSILLIALAGFFYYLEIPWYVSAAMVFVAVAIIMVDIVRLTRIAQVDVHVPYETEQANAELEPGEVLVDTIPAVMQYGNNRSVEVLGAGQVLTPENALLITNKAVWALTVPLAGADKVVSGTDIGKWQWMHSYQDIIDMLRQMTTTLPLEEVLKQGRAKRLMRLEDIKSSKTLPLTYAISLRRSDGKKFGYSIRRQEDFQRAKKIFNIS